MRHITKNMYIFIILYVTAFLTIFAILFSFIPMGGGMEPATYLIAMLGIIVCAWGMSHYRALWTDFICEKNGVTVVRPSLLFPLLKLRYSIRCNEIEYAMVEIGHTLSKKSPYFLYEIEALTIVTAHGKKYPFVIESKIENNGFESASKFRKVLKDFSDTCKAVPIFVEYTFHTDVKEVLQHQNRVGLVRDPRVEPEFYLQILEKYITKGDNGLHVADFLIPDDIPHIDLKKGETPEDKLREMKLNGWEQCPDGDCKK